MSSQALPLASVPGEAATAVLKIDGLTLMMPQRELRAVEAAADMDLIDPAPHSAGWITHLHQPWPVYCPDGELALLPRMPAGRRACILLEWSGGYVGLLCDDVSVAKELPGRRYELPPAMALPDSPLQGLLALENGLACITNGPRLTAHILRLALD